MSNQGVFNVAQVKGDERLGQDDDGEPVSDKTRVVQTENRYLNDLKERLARVGVGRKPEPGPATAGAVGDTMAELDALEAAEAPKNPGFVVYGDDGRPID